jgi:hypothetical protein
MENGLDELLLQNVKSKDLIVNLSLNLSLKAKPCHFVGFDVQSRAWRRVPGDFVLLFPSPERNAT